MHAPIGPRFQTAGDSTLRGCSQGFHNETPSPQPARLASQGAVRRVEEGEVGGQPIECVSQEGDVLVARAHLILTIIDEGERLAQRARRQT